MNLLSYTANCNSVLTLLWRYNRLFRLPLIMKQLSKDIDFLGIIDNMDQERRLWDLRACIRFIAISTITKIFWLLRTLTSNLIDLFLILITDSNTSIIAMYWSILKQILQCFKERSILCSFNWENQGKGTFRKAVVWVVFKSERYSIKSH